MSPTDGRHLATTIVSSGWVAGAVDNKQEAILVRTWFVRSQCRRSSFLAGEEKEREMADWSNCERVAFSHSN